MTDAAPTCELLYDGACPLCRREIARLKQVSTAQIVFTDIHGIQARDDLPDKTTLLRSLHFKDASGAFLVGLEANVAAWQFSRYGVLFRWLLWWPVRPVAERLYALWADTRFRKRYAVQRQ